MSKLTSNIIMNIEKWRANHNLTQKQMSAKIGMTPANYTKLISGEVAKISVDTIVNLYLLTGMFVFQLAEMQRNELLELVDIESKLSPSAIRFLLGIAKFEYHFEHLPNMDEKHNFINVFVPTSDMSDGMYYDSSNIIKVDIGEYAEKFNGQIDCGILITSNHLHNAYHEGDILLIKWADPRDGDVGIFIEKLTNRVFIRKFRQGNPCRLLSITDRPNDITVDPHDITDMDKWIKFGVVITKFRNA